MSNRKNASSAYLGIDLGTSSVKAVLVDEDGNERARAREALALETPAERGAEQDPVAWWTAARAAIVTCKAAAPRTSVRAIGLTGQKHALLPLDAEGRPLSRAVLWADGRATAEAAALLERVPDLAARTGAPPLAGYLVPKWLRLRLESPTAAARTAALCSAKDWLRLCLSGTRATDRTEACASQLYDSGRHTWDPGLCERLGVPLDFLPPVYPSACEAGRVGAQGAADTGLDAGTPLAAGAGDNEAAALGCGAVEPGVVAVVLGTSGTVVALAERRGAVGGLVWGEHVLERGVAATGTVLSAGRALDWFRRIAFAPAATWSDVTAAAAAARPSAVGPLFVPTLEGERSPVPDSGATGAFVGLRASHGRADLARAVMEGVAIALGQTIDLLRRSGVAVRELRLTSGGSTSGLWRQLVAAAADAPVRLAGVGEAPARGAALLAACLGRNDAHLVERAAVWACPGPLEVPARDEVDRLAALTRRFDRARAALAGPPSAL